MSNNKKSYKEWIKDNENKWISAGIIAIVCAVAMPITIYFASNATLTADSFAKLGTVGDFLGGTTVGLLSLASILFLISTIIMQRKELGMQREELQLTRDELVKANQQYEITNQTMLKQQFETTFFNMINMHNSLVAGLKVPQQNITGRESIVWFYEEVNKLFFEEFWEIHIEGQLKGKNVKELFDEYKKIENINENGEKIDKVKFEDYLNTPPQVNYWGLNLLRISEINRMRVINHKHDFPIFINSYLTDYNRGISFEVANRRSKYFILNYIESIKSIIKYVDKSGFVENKDDYLNIFISQFSMHEITIINYFREFSDTSVFKIYFDKYSSLGERKILKDSILYE